MTHNFVYNNGYKCCIKCGESEKSHYWNDDLTYETINRELYKQPIKKIKDNKWKTLLYRSHLFLNETPHFLHKKILEILNILPLSLKAKKNLYIYIISKKYKSYNEIRKAFYNIICIHDLPITSKKFVKILNTDTVQKFKPLTKLRNTSVRKYYWYISKQIENARKIINFSYEESQDIYKIVFDYYNLIRFKMLKSPNPIYLIHNLVYYTIREKIQPNQQHFNKNNFKIKDLAFITSLIKILKEIKSKNLDSNFIETLQVKNRFKFLKATI